MARVDAAALENLLAAVDVRLDAVHRREVHAGGQAPLASNAVTLVYVVAGDVETSASADDCGRLTAGDAFLSFGRSCISLASVAGAELMVAELQLSGAATPLTGILPSSVTVRRFQRLEPAAAGLADSMGRLTHDGLPVRTGDLVICRMMAATVLLSVIRAWADAGCAPEGWPTRPRDPFLDRVVAVIHEQPGREWTVEALAEVGAMSRSVFAERFRSAYGRSPASYVTGVRMDEAKRMLESGLAVSVISRSLGYASDEGFRRAFRRATGMTPSVWRTPQPVPALIPA